MTDEWLMRLREAIEKNKAEKGEAYQKLADRAAVHRSYVSQIMNNDIDISVGSLIKICRALDLSTSYVLTGEQATAEHDALNALFANATPKQRQLTLEFLGAMRGNGED